MREEKAFVSFKGILMTKETQVSIDYGILLGLLRIKTFFEDFDSESSWFSG